MSSIAANQGANAVLTDDEQAVLAGERRATNTVTGTTKFVMTVKNQYPAATTLAAAFTINGSTVDLAETGRV